MIEVAKEINWGKIEARYINSAATLEELAEEFNISLSAIKKRASQGKWKDKRTKRGKKHAKKCIEKTNDRITKRVTKTISDSLESEAKALDKMLKIVHKALDDELQFNRYLVQRSYSDENGIAKYTEERIFNKLDLKSFNALVSSLEKLEKLHRSLGGLVTKWQQSAIEVNIERLAIERERLDIAKAKEIGMKEDMDVGIAMMPEVDIETYQKEQQEYLEQFIEQQEGDKT